MLITRFRSIVRCPERARKRRAAIIYGQRTECVRE